jgi:ribonucleoside-diphosphate reductase alpha subunit
MMQHDRDKDIDFFGLSTMQKLYCCRCGDTLVERPQHMWLRVAIVVTAYPEDLMVVKETYDALSLQQYTHGSPTLFNAGVSNQMASCFLLSVEDSIESIFGTLKNAAHISKYGGGLGLHVSAVRGKGQPIGSSSGRTDGLLPMLKVWNSMTSYVNQSGRRKGACAVFLEPHHPDLMEFLDMRQPGGDEDLRNRDLFMALWVSDLFMRRVEQNGIWSFLDPYVCPDIQDAYGDEYARLYEAYEREGKVVRQLPALDVWNAILQAQIESGQPYMSYKCSINRKSNQQNVGTIRGSNLCNEIVEYTSPDEIAVCTLASVSLPAFVKDARLDEEALGRVTRIAIRNLDACIDANMYPVEEATRSNMRHRPVGLGAQGLADVFFEMGLPFDSEAALDVTEKAAACMYYHALDESCRLAREKGAYPTFQGSPASKGLLQPDLWGVTPHPDYDWDGLRARIREHGIRHSLCIAYMPTASTASIFGNTEATEPISSLAYVRRTLCGEFTCVNHRLVRDLVQRGLWTDTMRRQITGNGGSLRGIEAVPDDVKRLYVTAYDIKQKWVMDHMLRRGPYTCQSQSCNVFMDQPTYKKLTASHFYAWRRGAKTSMYYLRSKPAAKAQPVMAVESNSCINCSG